MGEVDVGGVVLVLAGISGVMDGYGTLLVVAALKLAGSRVVANDRSGIGDEVSNDGR